MLHVHVNKAKWDELPDNYKAIVRAAAARRRTSTRWRRYDAQNPQAIKRLAAAGTQLRPFSEAMLDVCFKAANEVYAEISGKNEDFKKIWEFDQGGAQRPVSVAAGGRRAPTTPT